MLLETLRPFPVQWHLHWSCLTEKFGPESLHGWQVSIQLPVTGLLDKRGWCRRRSCTSQLKSAPTVQAGCSEGSILCSRFALGMASSRDASSMRVTAVQGKTPTQGNFPHRLAALPGDGGGLVVGAKRSSFSLSALSRWRVIIHSQWFSVPGSSLAGSEFFFF